MTRSRTIAGEIRRVSSIQAPVQERTRTRKSSDEISSEHSERFAQEEAEGGEEKVSFFLQKN